MTRKRTIGDIALLAGVSKATVSRVLNQKPDVDPTTRERILRIVEEEGFVPSLTASGLARRHSHLIGVLVPSFTWPMVPDIVCGIAEAIGDTPYELVLYSINEQNRVGGKGDVIDHILASDLVAGLLSIFPGLHAKRIIRLHQHGFSVVMIDDHEHPSDVPWITADNQQGAYEAVCHLLKLGHRRIAHIRGPMDRLCSHERYQGYCRALEDYGVPIDPTLVVEGTFTRAAGIEAAHKLFTASPPRDQRFTAIFAASDDIAYGVMLYAEDHGIHIPDDLALIGFDDIASSAHVRPPLTTVKQPFQEMGRQGAKLLLSIIQQTHQQRTYIPPGAGKHTASLHQEDEQVLQIQLATSLLVRASCGAQQRQALSSIEQVT